MSKVLIVFWSGTGNTLEMANAIEKGIQNTGAQTDVFNVSDFDSATIEKYDKIAFGCPSMGDEVLEESEFEPFFMEIENQISGKNIALFGSYGWGDGAWMRSWEDRVRAAGGKLFEEGMIVMSTPDNSATEECIHFGERFAAL